MGKFGKEGSTMRRTRWIVALALVVTFAGASEALSKRIMRPGGQPGAGGVMNLPIQEQDGNGTMYMFLQGGWIQQQGNMPLYSQGAMLMMAGQMAQQDNNQCRKDEKSGEYIFENLRVRDGCLRTAGQCRRGEGESDPRQDGP